MVYNFVPTWEIIKSLSDFNILHVDLGGPTIVKAAAINYKRVLPVVSPQQYEQLTDIPHTKMSKRINFARTALEYCSEYDRRLSDFLGSLIK